MVHVKYTYKKGKRFGPYLYENKRVNGKVITTYLGPAKDISKKEKKEIFNSLKIIGIVLVLLLLFFGFKGYFLTGNVSLNIKSNYGAGEELSGALKFNIKEGELIPADSIVRVDFGGGVKDFVLSDLVSEDIVSGDFYAENSGISGNGAGYGLIGEKEIYPDVDFELRVFEVSEEAGKNVGASAP